MPLLIADHVQPGTLAAQPQPTLRAADLVLRPWQDTDATAVAAGYSEPAIQLWHARSLTVDEAVGWIARWAERWAKETGAGWAVADAATGTVLGQISLRVLDLPEGLAEVSYWTLPEARGRRVAPKALSTLADWLFDEVGIHRFELQHSTRNEASCRVAERVGFPLEGTLRDGTLHADGWHDMHLHARLSSDPRPAV
jgi:[ribosomal protein S5]-alanine N-acetyltransferase